MTKPSSTIQADLKTMRVIAVALMGGVLIFALIIILLQQAMAGVEILQQYNDIVLGVAIAIAAMLLLFARSLYGKKIQNSRDSAADLSGKLNFYKSALILYLALCEGTALFSIILFFLSGNYWLLSITFVLLLAMVAKFPARGIIIHDLQLDWMEQQEFT